MIPALAIIGGITLFTTLLIGKQFGQAAYCFLLVLTVLVGLAIHGFDRLREIDLKGMRITLSEINAAKQEIFAKEKDLRKLAFLLTNVIMVDQSIGYAIDSFAVRDKASPLLREKTKKIREELGFQVDDRLPDMVQKWSHTKDETEKQKSWMEIENTINEILR